LKEERASCAKRPYLMRKSCDRIAETKNAERNGNTGEKILGIHRTQFCSGKSRCLGAGERAMGEGEFREQTGASKCLRHTGSRRVVGGREWRLPPGGWFQSSRRKRGKKKGRRKTSITFRRHIRKRGVAGYQGGLWKENGEEEGKV